MRGGGSGGPWESLNGFLFYLRPSGHFQVIVDSHSQVIVDYIDNKAPISSAGSRVGLVQFSSLSKTRVVFHFGDYNTAREVKRKIGALNYVGGMYQRILIRNVFLPFPDGHRNAKTIDYNDKYLISRVK